MREGLGGVVLEARVLDVGPLLLLLDVVGQEVQVDGGRGPQRHRQAVTGDAGPLQAVDRPGDREPVLFVCLFVSLLNV